MLRFTLTLHPLPCTMRSLPREGQEGTIRSRASGARHFSHRVSIEKREEHACLWIPAIYPRSRSTWGTTESSFVSSADFGRPPIGSRLRWKLAQSSVGEQKAGQKRKNRGGGGGPEGNPWGEEKKVRKNDVYYSTINNERRRSTARNDDNQRRCSGLT